MSLLLASFLPFASLALPEPSVGMFRSLGTGASDRGVVQAELFIDPEGVVVACTIVLPELSREAGAARCARVIGKGGGEPAIGPDGKATYGTTFVTRMERGRALPDREVPADVQVALPEMPEGRDTVRVELIVNIAADGEITHCSNGQKGQEEIGAFACRYAQSQRLIIKNGADGEPVSYVTWFSVEFVRLPAAAN